MTHSIPAGQFSLTSALSFSSNCVHGRLVNKQCLQKPVAFIISFQSNLRLLSGLEGNSKFYLPGRFPPETCEASQTESMRMIDARVFRVFIKNLKRRRTRGG